MDRFPLRSERIERAKLFVSAHYRKTGRIPRAAEIAAHFGYKDPASGRDVLYDLCCIGFLAITAPAKSGRATIYELHEGVDANRDEVQKQRA